MARKHPFKCIYKNSTYILDSSISCFFRKLPYILDDIHFEYITLGILIPILLISLFSKIKGSYRWFIFNQGIWDLFILYNVQCDKPLFYHLYERTSTCFYDQSFGDPIWKQLMGEVFSSALRHGPYSPLFLLTISRFLCMYYNSIYKRLVRPWKLVSIIVGFQAIFIFLVCLAAWTQIIAMAIYDSIYSKCDEQFPRSPRKFERCMAVAEEPWAQPPPWWAITTASITMGTPIVTLIITDVLAILIILKLVTIIVFQCIVLTCFCVILILRRSSQFVVWDLPGWFEALSNMDPMSWLSVLRIFCDSILILGLLTEYREALMGVMKYSFKLIFGRFKVCRISNSVSDVPIRSISRS